MVNTHDKQVGTNVRVIMLRRDWTQAAIVEALGLSQQAVSRRIRGVNAFSVEQVITLSRQLGVPLSEFIEGVPVPGAPTIAHSMSVSELVAVASRVGVDPLELMNGIAEELPVASVSAHEDLHGPGAGGTSAAGAA